MIKKVNIHWFRNDLRLDDNPSLSKATENSELIPIYIFDENATIDFNQGEASFTWLYESLRLLNKSRVGRRCSADKTAWRLLMSDLIVLKAMN